MDETVNNVSFAENSIGFVDTLEEEKKYFVQAKFENTCKFVEFSEITVASFLNNVIKEFKIKLTGDVEFFLFSNTGAKIFPEKFQQIFQKYENSPCFVIEVQIKSKRETSFITPLEIENYLVEIRNAAFLIEEFKQTEDLTNTSVALLIRHVLSLMRDKFGDYPIRQQKESTAHALITLFPCLKVKNSQTGGIDLLYNTTDGGLFGQKLKYQRLQTRKQIQQEIESLGEDVQHLSVDPMRIILSLKSTFINKDNLETVKAKLKSTLEFRKNMMKDKDMDLLEMFPYFFTNPELILFDFSERYKTIDGNALMSLWPTWCVQMKTILLEENPKNAFQTEWSEDIEYFFALIRLFPSKSAGRTYEQFKQSITKFIVYRKIGCTSEEMKEKNNNYPYIVAQGSSEKDIRQYFIELERHHISVPIEFSIIQTVDLFFKLHKTFHLDFDTKIEPMMRFIEHFIYKINDKTKPITKRMMTIGNKIQ